MSEGTSSNQNNYFSRIKSSDIDKQFDNLHENKNNCDVNNCRNQTSERNSNSQKSGYTCDFEFPITLKVYPNPSKIFPDLKEEYVVLQRKLLKIKYLYVATIE